MVVVTYRTEDDLDLIDMIRIQSIWMEMTSLFRGLETIAAAAAEKVRILQVIMMLKKIKESHPMSVRIIQAIV